MKKFKVLIIIPAFNEERIIKRLITDIMSAYPEYDILVVNDGSHDNTAEEAKAPGVSVVTHPFNLGIGGAVQTGYKIAHLEGYNATIQIDGDYQHDPAYLNNVLEPVLFRNFDLCIGSRFLLMKSDFKSTPIRRIGIQFFANLLRWITGIHLTDPTSGYRATGRSLIKHFSEYYPVDFPEPEAVKMAKRFNAKIIEVPVNMKKRLGGVSSIRYFSTIYYMVKVTLAILIDSLKRNPKEEL
ncbi:MAG: hypothetical protein A3G33_02880 [Omnitrophica bacterium RIFCSPLOWO2_12_FULL_44_17]|uniref:Glycosyltransferase 2-like domain-containing protein n=1 Tax=Candidatus Danuiimicrobium aquiferis TaxID=1801832 RepID=A0A1G1KVG5_9BACT|nr:MAG: hypothetical protein A3B72_04360 [Omnitrophica bacterium RIFCSPHIGHO2_02_FULL_45_28]OGW90872.1 MAG: hypothetical protein A3E74_01585 [Omnitrophica bacterium RIFCSPHIGHO2_12_FULL_44_12]OGW96923.1 MAG: hypothetical protein A3G33_02880 [Omnitrophica bacterium RIFCSPLOWO2_12_FULL_44_17]OGX03941.1 MAG: hypothetical protein A3J12_03535 [Omnitrophica bacterium RIFCSPLOWO2_02_FULL_44_11]